MDITSVEDIVSIVSEEICKALPGRLCTSNTLRRDDSSCNEECNAYPFSVVSTLKVGLDPYINCTLYVFYYADLPRLHIFAGTKYPKAYRKDVDKLAKEDLFTKSLDALYHYCTKYDNVIWNRYLSRLSAKYGIELTSVDSFAVELIEYGGNIVNGNQPFTEVVDCKKLAKAVIKVIHDMAEDCRVDV